MSTATHVGALSDTGQMRERNEDAVLTGSFEDGSWVLIVCDGMGGHDAGDVASRTASRRIYQEVNARRDEPDVAQVLVDALAEAHEEVLRAAARGSDMGTTAIIARIIGDRLWYAWVGDSRLLVLRDGGVFTRTEDHTVVGRMIADGQLDPTLASIHPEAGVLTQALGANLDVIEPSITTEPLTLAAGDVIVMCSDGLSDLVAPQELAGLCAGLEPEDAAETLVGTANDRGGHDNITVIVATHGSPTVPGGRRAASSRPSAPASLPPTRVPVRAAPQGWSTPTLVATALGMLILGLVLGWGLAILGAPVEDTAAPPPSLDEALGEGAPAAEPADAD